MERTPTPAELDRLFGKSKDSRRSRNVKLLIIALGISILLNLWLFAGIKNRRDEANTEVKIEVIEEAPEKLDIKAELQQIKIRLDKLESR